MLTRQTWSHLNYIIVLCQPAMCVSSHGYPRFSILLFLCLLNFTRGLFISPASGNMSLYLQCTPLRLNHFIYLGPHSLFSVCFVFLRSCLVSVFQLLWWALPMTSVALLVLSFSSELPYICHYIIALYGMGFSGEIKVTAYSIYL